MFPGGTGVICGATVGNGVRVGVAGEVGVADGIIATVGVGIRETLGVGVLVKIGVADGVADCAIWDPDAKTANFRETLLNIPKRSTDSIVIVCGPVPSSVVGLKLHAPLLSALASATIGFDFIVIFTV